MKKTGYFLKVIWAYWYFFVFVLLFLLLFPFFYSLLSNKKWYPAANNLRRVWAWLIFLFTGIIYSIKRESKLNKNQAYIFCPNHTSYLDIPLFAMCYQGHFRFMAKLELSNIPLFNIFFRTIDISVNRGSITESYKALRIAAESIEEGDSLVIFPEGKVAHHPPKLEKFKAGPFRLAIEKQVSVVPVTFLDNWQMLYVDKKIWGRPGIARIVVHKPISTIGLTLDDIESLQIKVQDIIENMIKEYGSK